jgi:magnesium transporter
MYAMTLHKLTHNQVTWIDIVNPTGADVQALRALFPYIHPLHLEDMLSPTERPKLDEMDNYLYVVLHFPRWDQAAELSRSREVDFVVGRNYVITVHDGQLPPLRLMRESCDIDQTQRERLINKSGASTFYSMVRRLLDYIEPILNKVEQNIALIEDEVFDRDSHKTIQDISFVRRDVIALRRILRSQITVLESLANIEHSVVQEGMDEYFGDVDDKIKRYRDLLDEQYEVINGLADTANMLANYRINDVMRVLTVISVIILPLSLIASIYGMNVDLPFAEHGATFVGISILMVCLSIAMLWWFRRRSWI